MNPNLSEMLFDCFVPRFQIVKIQRTNCYDVEEEGENKTITYDEKKVLMVTLTTDEVLIYEAENEEMAKHYYFKFCRWVDTGISE